VSIFSRSHVLAAVLAIALFVVSSVYIARNFEWRSAFALLHDADMVRVGLSVWGIHFVYIVVRALRWRLLLVVVAPKVRLLDLYWVTSIFVSLSILTPGQLGEALKIEMLGRAGKIRRLPGLGAFAAERVTDLGIVVCMGVAGLIFGSGLLDAYQHFAFGVAVLVIVTLLLVYFLLFFQSSGRLHRSLVEIRSGIIAPGLWIRLAVLSAIAWGLTIVGWQIVLGGGVSKSCWRAGLKRAVA
jgi:uncharacterized protein (TIRG00374 family)